jgi:hypothetical protein
MADNAPAYLKIRQGDHVLEVHHQITDFAKSDDDLDVVFVGNSGTYEVSLEGLDGDPGTVAWEASCDRDDTPLPTSPNLTGSQVSIEPQAAGSFRLIARAGAAVLAAMRFVTVQMNLATAMSFRTGGLFLRTGFAAAPVSGMTLDGVFVLQGGSLGEVLGTSSIVVGNVGNATADTIEVLYSGTDTGKDTAYSPFPTLDTKRTQTGNWGMDVFRKRSQWSVQGPTGSGGIAIRVSSGDNPEFQWADPHPTTHSAVASITGSLQFREYIVAFSTSFPRAYVPYFQTVEDWRSVPCDNGTTQLIPSAFAAATQQPKYSPVFQSRMVYSPPPPDGAPQTLGACPNSPALDEKAMDFALGQTVADAMAGPCHIVHGELSSSIPGSAGTVKMQVERTLLGDPIEGAIDLPYEPQGASPHYGDRLAHSWDRVRESPGGAALAVVTRRELGGLRIGDPTLVTPREKDFRTIDSLLEMEKRLNAPGETIESAMEEAAAGTDSALMGYLYARIWHREALSDPARANRLYAKTIGSLAVPAGAWPEIAEDMVLPFALLTPEEQHATAKRLSEFAKRDDVLVASAGFRGLGQIATFAPAAASSPDLATGLADAYRHMAISHKMRRERALEKALAIVME